jgi:hypothetical protein
MGRNFPVLDVDRHGPNQGTGAWCGVFFGSAAPPRSISPGQQAIVAEPREQAHTMRVLLETTEMIVVTNQENGGGVGL